MLRIIDVYRNEKVWRSKLMWPFGTGYYLELRGCISQRAVVACCSAVAFFCILSVLPSSGSIMGHFRWLMFNVWLCFGSRKLHKTFTLNWYDCIAYVLFCDTEVAADVCWHSRWPSDLKLPEACGGLNPAMLTDCLALSHCRCKPTVLKELRAFKLSLWQKSPSWPHTVIAQRGL